MHYHLRDLKWFFLEADGALGLKGQTYEPKETVGAEQRSSDMADEMIEKRLKYVERERRIRRALLRLREESGGVKHARVIMAYCGQRFTLKWVSNVWGTMGAVCSLTDTFRTYQTNGWFARMKADKAKQKVIKLKILMEAYELLNAALTAYELCAPKQRGCS